MEARTPGAGTAVKLESPTAAADQDAGKAAARDEAKEVKAEAEAKPAMLFNDNWSIPAKKEEQERVPYHWTI